MQQAISNFDKLLTNTILLLLGVASAPLYDSTQQRLVGVLTMTHLIRLMHRYYVEEWSYDAILDELEQLTIKQLRGMPP
jgi:hypothetical protein